MKEKNRKLDPFQNQFAKLVSYRLKNPSAWPSQTDRKYGSLAKWLSKQKVKASRNELKPQYFQQLISIGFSFEAEWDQNFRKLRKFVEVNKKWPTQRLKFEGIDLGQWMANQRQLRKSNKLNKQRIKTLNSIRFPWDPHDLIWDEKFHLLAKFREKYRERWPNATEVFQGVEIGIWCNVQRQNMKNKMLRKDRKDLLNKIYFQWSAQVVDLTGLKFNRLKVLTKGESSGDGKREWICLCDCGNITSSSTYNLGSGKKKSCGCLLREKASKRMRKVQRISARKNLQSANEVQARIDKIHGSGTIVLHRNTYSTVFAYADFTHWIHGKFTTKPIFVYRGSSHHEDGRNRTNRALEARRLTEESINDRLPPFIKIKPGTLISSKDKATFIDTEYGHWDAVVSNVLNGSGHPDRSAREQIKSLEKSNLAKYGVKYPSQIAKVALKIATAQNKIRKIRHWKTRKYVHCHGGYELAVAKYLNKNKINFEWQPKVFMVPQNVMTTPRGNQTTYRPDFYLPDKDLWIEIKGYFREDAVKKWAWFVSEYPNSELWDFKKLRELNIL